MDSRYRRILLGTLAVSEQRCHVTGGLFTDVDTIANKELDIIYEYYNIQFISVKLTSYQHQHTELLFTLCQCLESPLSLFHKQIVLEFRKKFLLLVIVYYLIFFVLFIHSAPRYH